MNNTKYLSLLSLAVTGVLCGATGAMAEPLLDSDLANFTAFGASAETPISTGALGSNFGNWSGGTNGASGFNAAAAALDTQSANGLDGAGVSVAQLAQALQRPNTHPDIPLADPDLEELVFGPRGNDRSAEPTNNDKDVARKDLCDTGIALLDREGLADICKDAPPRIDNLGDASHPATPADDGSDGNNGLQPGPGVTASPDNPIAAAFFPSALLVQSVPEPAMLALLAAGLAGLGFSRQRNTQKH